MTSTITTIVLPKLGTDRETAFAVVADALPVAGTVVHLDAGEVSVGERVFVAGLVEALQEQAVESVVVIRATRPFADHFSRAATPRDLAHSFVDSQ
ncbi:hypothetical protein GCM10025867_16640 [Frondihabitans sucicola]|uniref:Uncharacterized protein n=1 Tax=Frondihabitans sucicola TaxID=1268041 RepID=A0ABM8GLY4_9MICO|nr:hypothetical protein [Frondihabitans sucicola]BDZ49423.1 hypothetical protein GCM10025867_16640 [Frondihabitans sucicola]